MPNAQDQSKGQASDTARLDWLQTQAVAISVNTTRESQVGGGGNDVSSVMFQDGLLVGLFTVASQRVYGTDLRDAIDVAMETAALRRTAVTKPAVLLDPAEYQPFPPASYRRRRTDGR